MSQPQTPQIHANHQFSSLTRGRNGGQRAAVIISDAGGQTQQPQRYRTFHSPRSVYLYFILGIADFSILYFGPRIPKLAQKWK